MLKTQIHTKLTPSLSQKLLKLGANSNTFSFFQSPVYFNLIEHIPNYNPILITSEDDNGELSGSLLAILLSEEKGLKSKLSERIVIFGGPVLGSKIYDLRSMILSTLLEGLKNAIGSKVLFTQFRNFYDTSDLKKVFTADGFGFRPRANLIIDCRDGAKVWESLSENRQRQLRKMGVECETQRRKGAEKNILPQRHGDTEKSVITPSRRHAVTYHEPQSLDEVRSLYYILHDLYRHKVRKPLPGFDFFRYFFEKIHGSEWGKIFVIKYKGEVVGGIVCPITPGKTLYEMYICGKDKELKDKGVYPSVLATWAGIEYAIENGIPEFDFMGMGIPGRQYGVRDFKMRFGGEVVNYGRWTKINNPLLYHVAEFGYNVMALIGRV